ncbi:hypothetical protein MRQ36_09845 [Micromonospora sp. R77]|nr:hypothetical protein [Micromonospora sp. R77]
MLTGGGPEVGPWDWELEAVPVPRDGVPTPPRISGPTGAPSVTGAEVVPTVRYHLMEDFLGRFRGYEPVGPPQCVLTGTSTVVPTPNDELTPAYGQDITCTFHNRALPPPHLTLVKRVANIYGGTATPQDWVLTATPYGDRPPITGRSGEAAVTDVVAAAEVEYDLTESRGPDGYEPFYGPPFYPRCVYTGTSIDIPLSHGYLTMSYGSSVTCMFDSIQYRDFRPAYLTLVKKVEGQADPKAWTLTATEERIGGGISGVSGSPEVTRAPVHAYPFSSYRLAESGGPPGYEPVGPPECVLAGTDTTVDVVDGIIRPQGTQDIVCTFRNRAVLPEPARLTLVKQVENGYGGTAKPQDWVLTAVPPTGSGTPITGRSGQAEVTGVTAVGGVGYTLRETGGPQGYAESEPVSCVLDGTRTPLPTPNGVFTPAAGKSYTCTWRNAQLDPGAAQLTLVKKVWGTGDPTDWTLTAVPAGGGTPISGVSGSPEVTRVRVRVGVGYRLGESGGPPGYEQVGPPECVLTGTRTEVPVANGSITPDRDQDITCTFTNRSAKQPGSPWQPGERLPVTGPRLTGIIGGGLLATATGAALLMITWRRRRVA